MPPAAPGTTGTSARKRGSERIWPQTWLRIVEHVLDEIGVPGRLARHVAGRSARGRGTRRPHLTGLAVSSDSCYPRVSPVQIGSVARDTSPMLLRHLMHTQLTDPAGSAQHVAWRWPSRQRETESSHNCDSHLV